MAVGELAELIVGQPEKAGEDLGVVGAGVGRSGPPDGAGCAVELRDHAGAEHVGADGQVVVGEEHVAGLELGVADDVGVHLHNTRGSGLASLLAAVQTGVTQVDASVGGLGGCPFAPGASGNIATEEVVYLLEESGVSTGLDLQRVLVAAAMVENAVGHELSSNLYRRAVATPAAPRVTAWAFRG